MMETKETQPYAGFLLLCPFYQKIIFVIEASSFPYIVWQAQKSLRGNHNIRKNKGRSGAIC